MSQATQNVKVFELAKELNLKALDLIDKIKPLDLKLKNHMAELTPEQVDKIRNFLNPRPAAPEGKKKVVVRSKSAAARSAASAESEKPGRSVVVKKAAPATAAPAEAGEAKPAVVIRKGVIIRRESPAAEGSPEAVLQQAEEAALSEGLSEELPPSAEMPVASPEVLSASSEAVFTEEEDQAWAAAQAQVQASHPPPAENATAASPAPSDAEAAPTAEAAAPVAPAAPAVPPRRGPRYSIIRVVSAEPAAPKKPLIVEDAPATPLKGRSAAPRTFTDPELSRSASALLKEIESEEEARKKKLGSTPRTKEEDQVFKSTDYLRRERVYQPKKKRLSMGRNSGRGATPTASAHKRDVEFDTRISVEALAHQMAIKGFELVRKLKELGATQPDDSMGLDDWILDLETVQLLASEMGFEVHDETFNEELHLSEAGVEVDADQEPRSPVVTIMGHVDHGKTSLLDIIRRARVAAGEAGGITQHIGAYTVSVAEAIKNLQNLAGEGDKKDKKKDKAAKKKGGESAPAAGPERLTFLDTPGHAAFTAMRSRGAKVTDIVVLVVSAVDGVMPQTREAIDHAKAAGVPLIVAVNKMDLPEANPDRIKQQLGELNVLPEEWGGDTIFVNVSAKTGLGVDKLLEMIQLQAELLQLKARATGSAEGAVVEARLDKGRGPLATVLVRQGILAVGDYVVAGDQYGRVRALIDDKGKNIREAGPSTPVEVLGLSGVPEAGDSVNSVADEKAARLLSDHRREQKRSEASGLRPMSLEDLYSRMAAGELKELPIIIKSDVKGSAEAIQAALLKLPQDKVRLKILSTAVGGISESDVLLASASKAIILGFNVRPDGKAQNESERLGVQIKSYTIIYDLIEDVTRAMEGLLDPTQKETVVGRAEVRNVFTISRVGAVAGCAVIKGKVQRSNAVRLIRDGRVVYTGKLSGLKRFKDDAREVAEGYECGISIENFNDIKQGDIIEAFTIEQISGKLGDGLSAGAGASQAGMPSA